MTSYRVTNAESAKCQNLLQWSYLFVIWQKGSIWDKTWGKTQYENIFEIFEASHVVLSISSVKLRFTKSPLAAMFFNQFCPKSIAFLP